MNQAFFTKKREKTRFSENADESAQNQDFMNQ